MKYNVSKREARELGIKRVPLDGGSSRSSRSSGGFDSGKMRDLQKRYLGMMEPSDAEKRTGKQLENLISSRELGLQHAQDKPVAAPFVRGRQASIQSSTARQAIPLQTRLQQLQSERMAKAQGLAGATGIERAIQQGNLAYDQFGLQQDRFNLQERAQEQAMRLARERAARASAGTSRNTGYLKNLLGQFRRQKAPTTSTSDGVMYDGQIIPPEVAKIRNLFGR